MGVVNLISLVPGTNHQNRRPRNGWYNLSAMPGTYACRPLVRVIAGSIALLLSWIFSCAIT